MEVKRGLGRLIVHWVLMFDRLCYNRYLDMGRSQHNLRGRKGNFR